MLLVEYFLLGWVFRSLERSWDEWYMHLFCVLMVKHRCLTKNLYDLDFWLSIHFYFFFFF